MANNGQSINELVTEEAFKQMDTLEQKLVLSKKAFVDTAKAAKMFVDAIGGVKNFKDYSRAVDVAVKGNTALGASADKLRLDEIKLEMARRKNFDDFEKRLKAQQAAEEKASNAKTKNVEKAIVDEEKLRVTREKAARKLLADQQKQIESDTLLRNARIRNIDDYNRRLQQQQVALDKAAAKATEAARPYNRLNVELGVLRTRARDIGVQFGTSSEQFRVAAAAVTELDNRLRDVDGRLGQAQRNVGNYSSAFAGLGRQVVTIAASYLSFYAVLGSVRRVVTSNAEISDSLADVRRTAQLTEEEADNLLETFKGFDTRTGLKGLLTIAGIGGQIGIAKKDLEGFTRSIDKLAVVLSNEIPGGADAVATALGKINGVFGTQKAENTTVEESFNRTGSAILRLGQEGLATGEFLQDFTLRVAGAAKAANISLPTILAYGSVLEEAGASAEVAGTSLNRLIGSLSSKRDKFFAIARLADSNLTLKEFTKIINTDANAALQLFFKGLSEGNPTLTAFNDRLDTIGVKAGPSKNAILALAQNQELLTKKIADSNAAYLDSESISDQVAIKNDTLAGSVDRLNKTFENATTSGAIGKFFKSIIDGANYALIAFEDFFSKASEGIDKLRQIEDNRLIEDARGNVIPDNSPELAAAYARRRAGNTAAAKDEAIGRGSSSADIMAAGKSEVEIRKLLTAAIEKQTKAQKDLNYNQAFIRDPKNVGKEYEDRVAANNKFRIAVVQQEALVKRLREKVPALTIKKIQTEESGLEAKPEKGLEAKENKRIKLLSESYAAATELAVADLENKYKLGTKDEEATANFEIAKYKLIAEGIEKRQQLYKKDSTEYKKLEAEKISANTDAQVAITKETKRIADEVKSSRLKANQSEIKDIESEGALKLSLLKKAYVNGAVSKQQYEQLSLDIQEEYSDKAIQAQIRQTQELIDGLSLTDKERIEAMKTLRDFEIKYADQIAEHKIKKAQSAAEKQDDIDKQLLEKRKEDLEKRKEIARELFTFTTSLFTASFTNQLNTLQDEIDLNDRRKAQDIENVNKSVATEEEKADRIAIINAKAESQQNAIEQRQREIKTRQAKADKAAAVAQAIMNGALAMTKVAAQTGIASFVFSPLIAALTALQVATILATPIPKFEHGGVMQKNGLAMYGEVGSELMIDPSGKISLTPEKPTVGYVQAGTEFISHKDLLRMMSVPDQHTNVDSKNDLRPLIDATLNGNGKLERELKKLNQSMNNKPSGPPSLSKRGLYETNNQSVRLADWKRRNL